MSQANRRSSPTSRVLGLLNLVAPTERDKFLSLILLVLLVSIYVLTMSGHHYSVDGIAMYQQSKTLLFHHTFRFSPPFVWGAYRAEFVFWPEGLSLVYLIPLALFSYVLAPHNPTFRIIPESPSMLLSDPSYVYLSITNCLITALTAVALFNIAIRFKFPRKVAIWMTLVFGLMSPAFAYQKQDFAQPLAALLITLTILLYLDIYDPDNKQKKYLTLTLASLCLGLLLLTRTEAQLIVVPLFVGFSLVKVWHSSWREKVFTGMALLIPLTLCVALRGEINYLKTGLFFGVQGYALTSFGDIRAIVAAFLGLLVSPGRGLLIFFPLALFAPVGAYRMFEPQRLWCGMFVGLIVLHLAMFSIWPIWWGGLSWGPRFLVPILPLVTLLAFWPHAEYRTRPRVWYSPGRLARASVTLVGLVMTLSAVLLRWDAIESQHGPPPDSASWTYLAQGLWYFRLDANGVWTNWRDLRGIRAYDLLVIQSAGRGAVLRNLIVAVSLALIVIVGKLCLNQLFRLARSARKTG
jgi:hypothetical protein